MSITKAYELNNWLNQWDSVFEYLSVNFQKQSDFDENFARSRQDLDSLNRSMSNIARWARWQIEIEKCRDQATIGAGIDERLINEIILTLDQLNLIVEDENHYTDDRLMPRYADSASLLRQHLFNIGTFIDQVGGFELMQTVYRWVQVKGQIRVKVLEITWNGIGQWRS